MTFRVVNWKWSVVGVVIIESPCSSREESEKKPVSYEVKPNHMYPGQNTLIEKSP